MGLFKNNKKLCPICGNPTPRLLPRKFDDQPICKECEKKIDLPAAVLDSMTLTDFKEYLRAYEENEVLRSSFETTYKYGGFLFSSEQLLLDEKNEWIRLKCTPSSWVIEKKYLKSFRIFEDDRVLFESGEDSLKCYHSEIPAQAKALEPTVKAFQAEKRAYERRRELGRLHALNESEEQRRERERIEFTYIPRFEDPGLFQKFRVEIILSHPYWTLYEETSSAPTFDDWIPSVEDYLKSYQKSVEELHLLAVKLMRLLNPEAGETKIGFSQTSTESENNAIPVDAVTELKRYKELLEQGIITEVEFAAKKKRILGI